MLGDGAFPLATGLASAACASPALAASAVEMALQRAGITRAQSVLLFLSADFAEDPRPALLAAARVAQTMSITGCTALGLMTDSDWVLDVPSAAALVFAGTPTGSPRANLILAAPDMLDSQWLQPGLPSFGGIAGDATGVGPFKVWRHGQIQAEGRCVLASACEPHLLVSRALRRLGDVLQVESVAGLDLQTLAGRAAAEMLRRSYRTQAGAAASLPPLHTLMLGRVDADDTVRDVWPVVSVNGDHSVTIAGRLHEGESVVWLERTAQQALADFDQHVPPSFVPRFGLMFSCGSRGATLHNGLDQEWARVRQLYPAMPLLGFYGNGQIAPHLACNQVLHHSVVLALS